MWCTHVSIEIFYLFNCHDTLLCWCCCICLFSRSFSLCVMNAKLWSSCQSHLYANLLIKQAMAAKIKVKASVQAVSDSKWHQCKRAIDLSMFIEPVSLIFHLQCCFFLKQRNLEIISNLFLKHKKNLFHFYLTDVTHTLKLIRSVL